MGHFRHIALMIVGALVCLPAAVRAEDTVFATGRLMTEMRAMVGKPMLDQTIDFSNRSPFVLESFAPEGSNSSLGETASSLAKAPTICDNDMASSW